MWLKKAPDKSLAGLQIINEVVSNQKLPLPLHERARVRGRGKLHYSCGAR